MPFLLNFQLQIEKSEDRHFMAWLRERRRELASLYHQLLDRITTFCLQQERYWQDAQYYAELWWHSPDSSLKPLQILIWLAIQQRNDTLIGYLTELRNRERAGEMSIGRSWSEWERDI